LPNLLLGLKDNNPVLVAATLRQASLQKKTKKKTAVFRIRRGFLAPRIRMPPKKVAEKKFTNLNKHMEVLNSLK
jgi:hypothetical protein